MNRVSVLAWAFIVLAVVGTAAVLFPIVRIALAVMAIGIICLWLLGLLVWLVTWLDSNTKTGGEDERDKHQDRARGQNR